ncbi:MAG: galactose mutarotase [Akkermansiaceae bacterium]|nr:galactose mutarotase [Akkermansiaceae bacterium]
MKQVIQTALTVSLFAGLAACSKDTPSTENDQENARTAGSEVASYGNIDGQEVKIYTLTNTKGMKARISEYGAILVSLEVPDKDGKPADVTLGYDTLEGWQSNTSYLGSTVGRYGNRIAHGKFSLDGKDYTLATNNDPGGIPCALHGGKVGFDKVVWKGEAVSKDGAQGVSLSYTSKDGEEGYPGTLKVTVAYWLTENNELIWQASATTDKATPVNIVHHSYWNLTGDPNNTINNHILKLEADHFLPTNAGLIPTGDIAPVAGTPMDFTAPTAIGKRVNEDTEALKLGGGYDHCWVLRKGEGVRLAATLRDPSSGRVMEILTDQPGIQFYGGNFLDGTITGKSGVSYQHRTGLCLETQHYPDSPNQPAFPNTILKPGETYSHTMVHRFSIKP